MQVFSICAFATISGYSGYAEFKCPGPNATYYKYEYDYPFQLSLNRDFASVETDNKTACNATAAIIGNFSSDAKFFVATGVLAMLYAIAIVFVYTKCDEKYRTNPKLPLSVGVAAYNASANVKMHALAGFRTDCNFWRSLVVQQCGLGKRTNGTQVRD